MEKKREKTDQFNGEKRERGSRLTFGALGHARALESTATRKRGEKKTVLCRYIEYDLLFVETKKSTLNSMKKKK